MEYNKSMKNVIIFDLDGTVINSDHRTPNKPDGTLDLQGYFSKRNRENIFKDTLLPLANEMRRLYAEGNYIIVSTSRTIDQDDLDFMKAHGLKFHQFFSREKSDTRGDAQLKVGRLKKFLNLKQFRGKVHIMFDDAIPVISAMRKSGITCLNSATINRRLNNALV